MIKKFFSNITENLRKAIKAYYFPLIMAAGFALSVCVIQNGYQVDFLWTKLAFSTAIGVSLGFGLSFLGQRYGRRGLWNLLGLCFLIVFFVFILPDKEYLFEKRYLFVLAPCFILAHLLVALAPYFSRQQPREKFWNYNKKLFINSFMTVVFSAVLTGGLELAILTIQELFNIPFNQIYLNIFDFCFIFGSSLIFALFSAGGLPELERDTPYPKVLKFFTQYVLIPLLFVYLIILVLYGIRILVNFDLPRGQVSYMVLIYALVGILGLLLVHPLMKDSEKSWIKAFRKVFFYTLLPLLVLLYVAIGVRIKNYGLTEGRYFVLFLAVWLTFISFYFLFLKKPRIRTIPLTLFGLGIFILLIPYFNVYATGIRSQEKRFLTLLEEG